LGGAVSGSAQSSLIGAVVPVANQISNAANTELTYQFSRNGMIGTSGTFTNLHYPDPAQVPGLSDSNSRGGAAFYNYRLSQGQYVGATYQYSQMFGSTLSGQTETKSETLTHTISLFYTIYLKPDLSLSVSGGPLHFDISQSPLPSSHSWAPAATASMGWQGHHASFAAGYAQSVIGGGGLLGAYNTKSASASTRWQATRTWTVGSAAGYSINKNAIPLFSLSNPGGHIVSGNVTVQHAINEHLNVEFGYTRLHQSYSSIAVISNAPDTNREYISFSYQFTRPLGR
jgi:hypothetical protein